MAIKKSKLYKHLINFTDKKASRPVLSAINFNSDGNLYATNSHIAIKVVGHNSSKVNMSLNPNNLKQLETEYPNVNRLFPDIENCSTKFSLKHSELTGLINFLKVHKKEVLKLTADENEHELQFELSGMEYKVDADVYGEGIQLYMSAEYLLINLQTFETEVNSDVLVGIMSAVKPIIMKSAHIETLITPIRTGN